MMKILYKIEKALIKKIKKKSILKEIRTLQDLVDSFKVDLYNIEHGLMDDASFDIIRRICLRHDLSLAHIDTISDYVEYASEEIIVLETEIKNLYYKWARYSNY